ncbi:small vasohibin-binding protein isoform X1 [Lampetra fluviatilis]
MNESKNQSASKPKPGSLDSATKRDKPRTPKEAGNKLDKNKQQKTALQETKARQRAEIYALNKVMTELEQQQFEEFCRQMHEQIANGEEGGTEAHDSDIIAACRV